MESFHRRGSSEGTFFLCTVSHSQDGWNWKGYRYRAAGRPPGAFGPVVASGGPYKTDAEARKAADEWFFSRRGIVEEPFNSIFYRY